MDRLIHASHASRLATSASPADQTPSGALLRSLGVSDSIVVPLRVGQDMIGALVLLGLMDVSGIDTIVLETTRGTTDRPAGKEREAAIAAMKAEGIDVSVVNCRFLKPYHETTLAWAASHHSAILTIEEGTVVNGFGAFMTTVIERHDPAVRVAVHGVPDRIIHAASRRPTPTTSSSRRSSSAWPRASSARAPR